MEISTTTNHVLTFADDDKSTVTINFNLGGKVVSLTCHADGSLTKACADTPTINSHINYLWSYPAEIKFGPSVTGLCATPYVYGYHNIQSCDIRSDGTIVYGCSYPDGYSGSYTQSFPYRMSDG